MIKVLDHINVTTHNFQKCIMEFLCRFFFFFFCQLNNHMLLNNNAIEFTVLSLTASLSFLSEINMMLSYWDAFRRIVGYHFAACISYGERWLSLQVNGEKFAHGKITLSEQTKWCLSEENEALYTRADASTDEEIKLRLRERQNVLHWFNCAMVGTYCL